MADLVLVTEAAEHSQYSEPHIRLLVRSNKVKGKKQGGIWLVHVGSDKSTNSCDAIRRIAECTPEQIVSLYKRVICADVQ